MAYDEALSIKGLQEAQARMNKRIAALKPRNALGRAIKYATVEAHRYLVSIIHVDTGSYRAAQHMKVQEARGRVYTDPGATNPRSGQKPAKYGVYEERRGGSHAAYRRTVREHGDKIVRRAIKYMVKELEL
jgi:hypothetical protein